MIKFIIILLALIPITSNLEAQAGNYSCQNEAYNVLKVIIGDWTVKTKDRTSPDVYENNEGISKISNSIIGCGIKESFRGTIRGKPYAVEVVTAGKDSNDVEMTFLDSEHSSFMIFKGSVDENQLVAYWYRNEEVKRMQSKHIISIKGQDEFEYESFLSVDYGETWALTHRRSYSREK